MKIIGIVNQKGGVAKTTTAVNLAAYLAAQGQRVLLLDMDPQGNATSALGLRDAEEGLYEALGLPGKVSKYTQASVQPGLNVLPATPDLAGAGVELADDPDALSRLLASVSGYDLAIIDAPPSLGPLTVNVLAAAHRLIIPLQAEYFALEGLAGLMETVERVQESLNPQLQVLGVVLTMFDGRTNLAQEVETTVRKHFGSLVFSAVIPRNVRLSEAPSFAQPINLFAPNSLGAAAYQRLAGEVMERVQKS